MQILNVIIYIIIFYIVHNAYLKYRSLHKNEVKGPTPIPILGNLHQLTPNQPHIDITNMSKKYGSLTRIWLADLYTVVISCPDLIREIYVEKFDNFMNRPDIPSIKSSTYFKGTITSKDEGWKRNREIVSIALRKTNLKHIYQLLDEQVDVLIESMKSIQETGEPFDQRYYLTKFTMSAMYKLLFNKDIPKDEDINTGEIRKLMKPLQQVFIDSGTGSLFDVLTIGRPFYIWYLENVNKNFVKILDYSRERLNEHLIDYNPDVQRDLLDILIKEYGTNKDDVMWILSTVSGAFLAGIDTSSTSLEIMLLLLANYQEIQEKAYSEIKDVLSKTTSPKVLLSDRASLPFLVAIIKESIRYLPISAFGLPRTTRNDITLSNGQFIPKDTQILINYHSLSQDEKYWDNPQIFDPTRFLKSETNPAYIPFSIGNRNCVGANFANDEMFLAISNILLNFKVKSIDGNQIDETQCYGLSLKPKPFKLILEKRS